MKTSIALAAAMSAALTSTAAMADVTANIGIATTYLWRGADLSTPAPAVSGGVDYSHESGLYAGVWHSSEGAYAPETDLYVGFSGEVEGFSYDVGYISYMYLQEESLQGATADANFSEIYFGVGFDAFGFTYALDSDNDNNYFSLSGEFDKFSVVYGSYSFDLGGDYTHIDLGYALTDELSVVYSMPSFDAAGAVEDPTLVFSYGLEFDVK